MIPAMQHKGIYHQQRCCGKKPILLGLPSHGPYRAAKQNYAVTAMAAVTTPSPIELRAAAQALQNNLGSSMLDIKQAAASFDSGAALQQVQSGIENAVTTATAPFDVFSGNWFLNLLLFGVAFLVASSIATGPKQ